MFLPGVSTVRSNFPKKAIYSRWCLVQGISSRLGGGAGALLRRKARGRGVRGPGGRLQAEPLRHKSPRADRRRGGGAPSCSLLRTGDVDGSPWDPGLPVCRLKRSAEGPLRGCSRSGSGTVNPPTKQTPFFLSTQHSSIRWPKNKREHISMLLAGLLCMIKN